MLRTTGIDLGTTDTREVSVGVLWGAPREGNGGSRRVASVRSDILTFRRAHLPLANRDTCRRVVQEELAHSLPFDVDDAAWDFTGRPGEEAWVVVAPSDRLEPVRQDVGETTTLDVEPLGYLRACMAAHIQSALVIDMGASKTIFCGIVAGRVDFVRVMLRGGIWLTKKLADRQRCSIEQAENLKRSRGTDLPELAELLTDLMSEAGLITPVPYDHVLLCGGGAATPGLKPLLRQRLGVDPELFPLPAALNPYEHVAAYGAALAGRPRMPRVRLVDQRLTAEAEAGGWKYLAFWSFVLMLLIVADLEVRHYSLQQRYDGVRAGMVAAVQPVLGKTDLPPEQMLERLKKEIAYGKGVRQSSVKHVMDTVGRLNGPLKDFPQVDLRVISADPLDNGVMKLEGSAASVKEATSLNQALAKVIPDLKQINVRTAEPGRVNFTFEGKIPPP